MSRFVYHGEQARCTLDGQELHCGDCFRLVIDDATKLDVRLERTSNDWYLIGAKPAAAYAWDGTPAERYGGAS